MSRGSCGASLCALRRAGRCHGAVGKAVEMFGQTLPGSEHVNAAGIGIGLTGARGVAQCFDPRLRFGFVALDQAQAGTQDFARILESPRIDERVDQLCLMVRENDVSGRHGSALDGRLGLADYAMVHRQGSGTGGEATAGSRKQ
ncbi:hypothetical protein PSP6_180021 [Paraburkholderia tropica]|nr:hypothetical protein PSP6_180021 [Paraburkholderia tropica]